jgi:hypothetical protein
VPQNFLLYQVQHLRKVNAQRRALSQPTIYDVPVLTKGQVQYIPEGALEGEPASCYNCPFFNYDRSCQFLGSRVKVKKLVYPKESTPDAKRIEYWPCCGEWTRGEPNYGPEKFLDCLASPDSTGLGWINAPMVGQEYGGANCGGKDGGDDCDHYCSEGEDKRLEPTAFCRVLQAPVECGAVCSAWMDDDYLSWDRAQNLLKELDGE